MATRVNEEHRSLLRNLRLQRFGRLTALRDSGKRDKQGRVIWVCLCACGNFVNVVSSSLNSGSTRSCGCLAKEYYKQLHKTLHKHGDAKKKNKRPEKLYNTWISMKARCFNPESNSYKWYGKKGITICPEWRDDYFVFKKWALRNRYKNGLTIDRIESDGDYEPSNCQWLTSSDNAKKQWRDRRNDEER